MTPRWLIILGALSLLAGCPFNTRAAGFSTNANRLAYLDESDPFYPGLQFPKLTTPQWVGEQGVEAVVILAIDDMRETERYEKFLRPILERLKRIDGRAPVSIMVNAIASTNAQLQAWLKEGVSLEVHTLAHPCPCLAKGDFNAAVNTYHGCVDLINQIPGNRPVAFRMPCCDSMNSPSPRFYAEIFNRVSPEGRFLTIDSSVMCILTTNDPALPRELVLDRDGREKFRKYLPAQTNLSIKVSMGSFTTTIEDYPYPYVIGKLCWEFPAMIPSDWEAFNLHGSTNATTLADWKAGLDATVLKQGAFTFIFHPHGWSSSQQFVEFIDYAMQKHGKKVKFLTFGEAQERLDRNLLAGHPLRAGNGKDNGVRLVDLNNDGFMDIVAGNEQVRKTRIWQPAARGWRELDLPASLTKGGTAAPGDAGVRFGVVHPDGNAAMVVRNEEQSGAWHFDGEKWREGPGLPEVMAAESVFTSKGGSDQGVRLRDIDNDGTCELIVGRADQGAVFKWSEAEKSWKKLSLALPRGTSIVDAGGNDNGLRFVDVNGDGYDDVLFSNEKEFSLHLFVPKANPRLMWQVGWNDEIFVGKRGQSELDIPMIARGGTHRNNGVWFANQTMWIQNEDTAHLPDKVDRRTFRQLLSADEPRAMSPEESLAAIRVRPGFKVELVASEPLVTDPIAFEWSPDGKLWVVEMKDYPLGKNNDGKPGGRIKFLEDRDGDGRYDKATVFLEDVNFPTGVMPWRKGVLVSAAPEIFYAEDTDGDGTADKRETLFTGFIEGNQQHRLNGFDYGLDNWVYGANGESGGRVRIADGVGRLAEARKAEPGARKINPAVLASLATNIVNISGRDFRFDPDSGAFEAVAGMTQFGRHRDDWGNWFGNNNPTWLWHYHIPEHYLGRNPYLVVKSTKQMLANYPESTRLYPASRTRQRFNDHHQFNHVTSGNSAMPYRDDLFGPDFATSVFISDPVHNVVHREVLEPSGVTFTSHRAPDQTNSEFLASTDNWFRPIMLKTGPDGALYIADMYRQVLEHPEWIPAHIKPRLDLRAGEDKGRIYRVYPTNATLRKIPRLDQLDVTNLVAALDSPNGWQRDTVQRLLVHRADPAGVPLLQQMLAQSSNPKARLQALCTLDGLGAVSRQDAMRAWQDPHPQVRAHGIRVAEPFGNAIEGRLRMADGFPEVIALANDPSPEVRYQFAFSLGEWHGTNSGSLLARLALRDFGDPNLRVAILSSATNHVAVMLQTTLARHAEAPAGLLEELLGLAVSTRKDGAIAEALNKVGQPERGDSFAGWQFAAFAAFLDALDRRNSSLEKFADEAAPPLQNALRKLDRLFPEARAAASRSTDAEAERIAATRLLGRQAQREEDLKQLGGLLRPEHPAAIHQAAIASLGRMKDAEVAGVLLAGWKNHSPTLREEVLAALFSRREWTGELVAQMEKDTIPARQLGAAWQQKLSQHSDRSIRERAVKLFSATAPDRQALLKGYAGVEKLTGNREHGFSLYRQHCATCHRLGGEGKSVGPDFGTIANKSVPVLVEAILDPNRAVEARYVSYTAVTKTDREVSGIITSESANNLTLRATDGREETLLRAELKGLSSSGLSLMPEGFEKALGPQDMADLLAALLGQ
jgi:putative membrane-bound dehydrogenase-like protein